MCGLYDVKPEQFGKVFSETTLASKFGEVSQIYNGIDWRSMHDSDVAVCSPEVRTSAGPCSTTAPWSMSSRNSARAAHPFSGSSR